MTVWVTSIEIEANVEDVWKIFSDYKNFPKWNPFIPKIWGTPKDDNVFVILVNIYKFIYFPGPVKLKICKKNEVINYVGAVPKFMAFFADGDHKFTFEKISESKTKFSHHANMGGLILNTGLKIPFIASAVHGVHEEMNKRLKDLAEQAAQNTKQLKSA